MGSPGAMKLPGDLVLLRLGERGVGELRQFLESARDVVIEL
jgi:hypothetical protein